MLPLKGKRVLLIGAQTHFGASLATALTEAGATLALVATSPDPEAAFAVQRLARKLGAATSQAIDGANETAVKVMLRQVAKALGGLDASVVSAPDQRVLDTVRPLAEREMARTGRGFFLVADQGTDVVAALAALPPSA
jgi:NAD(P)-dependent dehydrogenase (short-subunit alcohol dehydrogenase family)